MHPIGQILNFYNRTEFQNRDTEHMYAPIHSVDAPKIDENENNDFQFVTGVYEMLTYLTYLCKSEQTISELMKKASREAYGEDIKFKMHSIDNISLTKFEVSTHGAIKRE